MTTALVLTEGTADALPLHAVAAAKLSEFLATLPAPDQLWLTANNFKGEAGSTIVIPNGAGGIRAAVVGLGKGDDPWVLGGMAKALPPATYTLTNVIGCADKLAAGFSSWAAQAWALGAYTFKRYKKTNGGEEKPRPLAKLVWPAGCDRGAVERNVAAAVLTRDLINTPAADMMPADLAEAIKTVGQDCSAQVTEIVGDELLKHNYPMIHAVGRASTAAPRLIDLRWGREGDPKITLVGKGVCFDTGGLDLKSASSMALMKKDMGGAATLLGLAQAIMNAKLPVRLRLLVPAVENAVAGNAFRPSDVLATRKGTSVEIGNTDAEGRLILADALTEASSEKPELLIDCATLTGAARTALGPDLPAMFTDDDQLAAELTTASAKAFDPVWRLPLWTPYRSMLDSKIADINNTGDSAFAGAITAALFLKEFVGESTPWIHLDLYAWNKSSRPGRPEGGEAYAQRALFELIATRFNA
ncbi:MAG: leucyl aminopeptidase family protein [Rhodospirillaceae bacterium]|nr:leucyl aminopeptidase family protein [Rhodospirillaceae bacterium]